MQWVRFLFIDKYWTFHQLTNLLWLHILWSWQVLKVWKTCRAFHTIKNSGLNFTEYPVKNGTAISRISRKEHNLARYTEILRNMLAGISVSFVFTPGNFRNFRLNGSLIANPTVTGFSGNFPRTYIYLPYVQVSKFSEFLVYLVNHWKVNRGPRYLHINFYNFLQQ